MAAFDEDRPEVDGGAGTDGEDGGGGGGGDARDIAAVRASAGRGVFYVESKPAQVRTLPYMKPPVKKECQNITPPSCRQCCYSPSGYNKRTCSRLHIFYIERPLLLVHGRAAQLRFTFSPLPIFGEETFGTISGSILDANGVVRREGNNRHFQKLQ